MRRARWPFVLLVGAMSVWSGFTGFVGWQALRGEGAPGAPAAAPVAEAYAATYDVAAPGAVRHVRSLTEEEEAVLSSGRQLAAPVAEAPQPDTIASRPVPRLAQSAGIDRRVRPVDSFESRRPTPEAAAPAVRGVIVLDPGHGRGDPGAVHHWPDGTYLTEGSTNLRTAHLLRSELQARGFEVYLTREDEGRGPGRPLPRQFIVSDLLWRASLAEAVDADVYLALNSNGASVKSIRGPETWYCGKHAQGSANERLATLIQQAQMDTIR